MTQEQAKKDGGAKQPVDKDVKEEKAAQEAVKKEGEELKKKIDGLVDEVDDILEKNAEEFVKNYVQKGGE